MRTFFGDRLKNFCEDLFFFFFFWRALALVSMVLGLESVCPRKGCPWLGLGFFLCPWPWPRALCPRIHLYYYLITSVYVLSCAITHVQTGLQNVCFFLRIAKPANDFLFFGKVFSKCFYMYLNTLLQYLYFVFTSIAGKYFVFNYFRTTVFCI